VEARFSGFGRHGDGVVTVVLAFVFGRWDVTEFGVQAVLVEPVDVLQGGDLEFNRLAPWAGRASICIQAVSSAASAAVASRIWLWVKSCSGRARSPVSLDMPHESPQHPGAQGCRPGNRKPSVSTVP
jgi:hypothetical protein